MFCEPAFVAVADAAAKQGGMEAGPSGTNAGDGGDQGMAPPPPRKVRSFRLRLRGRGS